MACSKIFSGDLPELTDKIIQYFQNDFSTLYSCVLVNRLWCRLSIPLLWENPFSKDFIKNYYFINIYLNKLNEDDKLTLKEYGIIIPSSTLFNYPSFIKCLNIQCFSKSIIFYTTTSKFFKDNFIFLSLIKIFIENGANLHTFELKSNNSGYETLNSLSQLILKSQKFICNVKNLRIDFRNSNNFYSLLLKCFYLNCDSISSLYLSNSYWNEHDNLSKVIDSQKNLQKISFSCISLEILTNSNCLNTLKTIIFYGVHLNSIDFYKVFEQPNVLESIHILYCYNLDTTIIQQIFNLTKPFKLKSLFVELRSLSQVKSLELLLQRSGNYLENIGFEPSSDYELKLRFFKFVKIYCVKIKFLEIFELDVRNTLTGIDLIKNIQQNLNYLSIKCPELNYIEPSSIILQNLGQILPYKLEYLSLDLKFNINDLKIFFKNSQNIFIKKLLIKNKFYLNDDDILPCIKEYIMKEKRVSYLAMEINFISNNPKDLFKLKDEVEEFKFYGIQVMFYDDLCINFHNLMNELLD